ncbi:hypothetical protein QTP88_008529 [Uroleucon formosanum]
MRTTSKYMKSQSQRIMVMTSYNVITCKVSTSVNVQVLLSAVWRPLCGQSQVVRVIDIMLVTRPYKNSHKMCYLTMQTDTKKQIKIIKF